MATKKETILIKLDIDTNEAQKKIVENTTAIRNFAAQNRDLAKSLKEGKISEDDYTRALLANAKAVDALKNENKQLDQSIKAQENSVEGLRAQIALLTAEANKMDLGSDEFVKAQEKLELLNKQLIEIGEDRADFRANVGNYSSAVKGFENRITELNQKLAGLNLGSKEFAETKEEIEKVTKELENLQGGVGKVEGKLNDIGNLLGTVNSGFSNLGTSLKSVFGPAAIIGGIAAATGAIINFKMELDNTREQVNLLTGASGDDLDKITAKVQATASTFDKDFNETLLSANTTAKSFGISVQQATDLIQKGFVNGADASGNFLGDLTEFAPQFNAIGVSADEAIAILSQQPESGVFSNKGIDAIKEAGLRLKEMPQSTADALNAIGISSKTLQKQIQDGTITSFEAIQQVSGKLSELPPNSQKAAQAVADIFGGAGQDAGLEYLTTLKDINTDLDKLSEGAGEFANANLQIVDAQERINLLFNQILGSGGNTFNNLKAGALDFVANALEFIINGTIEVINWFRELYNESLAFRAVINYIKVSFQNTWAAIKLIFTNFIDQLKNAGALLKAIFTGDFEAIPGLIKNAFNKAVDNVKGFGEEVAGNIQDGIRETLNPSELLEPISLAGEEAVAEAAKTGEAVGTEFNDGVKKTREDYLKDQKAFLEAQLLQTEKNSQKELEIKLKIIEVSRDIELENDKLTANERLLIQTQAFVDSMQAQKDYLEAQKQAEAEALEARLKLIEEGEERKTLLLQQQLLNREVNEQQFNENLFAIREEALAAEIAQLEEGTLAKLEKEVELEQLRADHLAEIKQKELETSNLLKDTEIKNDQARLESAQMLADGVAQVAGEATLAGKIAMGISKGLAIAELVMNLQQELAANAAAGAKISAQSPPYTIPAGVAYTTTRNVLAGVRTGVGIAKIASTVFADGGQAFADNLAFSGGSIPRYGGMITGLPHGQGGVKFSMGGAGVGEADGRKGEAYIVNTRKNPMLKAMASVINVAGGGKGFFDMGGVVKYAAGGVASGVSAGSLLPTDNSNLIELIENLKPPIVLVDDVYNGLSRKADVENGAIL